MVVAGSEPTDRELVVTGRVALAEAVTGLELAAADRTELPAWQPGAHIDVLTDSGLVRQYSLCSDAAQRDRWRIAVLDEPAGRGGSSWITAHAGTGRRLATRGPRNHFTLDPARRYVFVAGGVGITPIRAMIFEAESTGTAWELHYAGRSRATMAFAEELVAGYPDRVRLYPGDEGARMDLPTVFAHPARGTLAYCCGPRRLLAGIDAAGTGWEAGAIRAEHFVPKQIGDLVRATEFEVELLSSALTLTVPRDRSVLDVVEEHGVPVLSSCREGTCGTCETRVVSGEIEHRDSVLTPGEKAAGNAMMICVSRAAGPRLVLEL